MALIVATLFAATMELRESRAVDRTSLVCMTGKGVQRMGDSIVELWSRWREYMLVRAMPKLDSEISRINGSAREAAQKIV